MNANKPVAIVNTNCENNIQWYDDNPKQHNGYFLYTHPEKELTYEDGIEECAQRAEAYAYLSPNFTALAEELRAILRKAQSNCNGFCGEYECKENKTNCLRKAQEK